MALIVKTVGSAGGRDFSTLASWAAFLPANLVTAGNSYEADLYNDSEFTASGGFSTWVLQLTGHTTDATHNITVTTGAGQSFRDNASVQTNALKYNVANGVGIRGSSAASYQTAVEIDDEFVTFTNIQVTSTAGRNAPTGIYHALGLLNNVVNNCIFQGTVDIGFGGASFSNCLFYSLVAQTGTGSSSLLSGQGSNGSPKLYFCTIASQSDFSSTGDAVHGSYSAVGMENCAVFGFGAVTSGGSGVSATTCMTDLASPPTGFTGSKTYANQFVGITTSVTDYREKTGADLQGAATADPTHGATDIAGTARPQGSNWDIGCWELVSGAAAPSFSLDTLFDQPKLLRPKEWQQFPFGSTASNSAWVPAPFELSRLLKQPDSWKQEPITIPAVTNAAFIASEFFRSAPIKPLSDWQQFSYFPRIVVTWSAQPFPAPAIKFRINDDATWKSPTFPPPVPIPGYPLDAWFTLPKTLRIGVETYWFTPIKFVPVVSNIVPQRTLVGVGV